MSLQKRYDQYMYSYPHKSAYDSLGASAVGAALTQWEEEELTLYVHVPFCSFKCGYCNLFSVTAVDEEMRNRYMDAVCRQIRQYGKALGKKKVQIKQVILGGGTPFLLTVGQFEPLFLALEQQFGIRIETCGFDIETSPRETTEEKLAYLKGRGMRRLSIGIQSFQDDELKRIDRHHTVKQCREALAAIKKINPASLNLDLIYGIEGQTEDSFLYSLKEALTYEPDELFLYPLYVRKDTGLYGKMEAKETLLQELYESASDCLIRSGYVQTSMRRFAKRKSEIETSCGFESMLSFGCGGRSYLGNTHFCEPYEVNAKACHEILESYIKKEDFMEGMKGYLLNREEQMRRFVIKNLGYYRGISLEEYEHCFGQDLMSQFEPLWQELKEEGMVRLEEGRVMLTPKGMGNSDCILAMWISEDVNRRMDRC